MGDVAAAAAAAAVEQVYHDPSPEISRAIGVAAQATTAAAVEVLAGNPTISMEDPVGASSAAADSPEQHLTSSGRPEPLEPSPRQDHGVGRKRRQSISLGDKLALIDLRESGHFKWSDILSMFQFPIAESTARGIYKNCTQFKRRAAAEENLFWTRQRVSYFEEVSAKLWEWYQTLQRVGGKHPPVSGGILEARARLIAAELGVTGFKGSPQFMQKRARRYNLHNIAPLGTGGSADAAGAEPLIAGIRKTIDGYSPERIYNVDETGLFYRGIPNRTYVTAVQRRWACGTKAMNAKSRVTLGLACNDTGTHKIAVAMDGKAKEPLCLKRPRQPCPLP